jgi:outer membrane protein TolC
MRSRSVILSGVLLALAALGGSMASAADPAQEARALSPWPQPLSLADCLNIAIAQNGSILKSRSDLEAAHGIIVQTKAIVLPKLRAGSAYQVSEDSTTERFPIPAAIASGFSYPDQKWSAHVQLIQSIYEGGRMRSALRTAKLTKDQALLSHQAVVADALLEVRIAFDAILLAKQLVVVQEASIALLKSELEDATRRFDAGTVPRFNVLRAEVELANTKPKWIRAQNSLRLAKNKLANLMGCDIPKEVGGDVPMELAGSLETEAEPFSLELALAIAQAREHRPEMGALKKAVGLRDEAIILARAGYKPSVQLVGGYGSRSSTFDTDLTRDVSGWSAGAQMSWDIFDGLLTKGKVDEARARLQKARVDLDDTGRKIELEVRTAHSYFVEAKEVLESQKKVGEQADEALRLARARSEAGTGTQLDVLNAQTALTEARTIRIQALHDFAVARARLERAIGQTITPRP